MLKYCIQWETNVDAVGLHAVASSRQQSQLLHRRRKRSVNSRASVRILDVGYAASHAFGMMLSATRLALAKGERRSDAETT